MPQKTSYILSLQNLVTRTTCTSITANRMKTLTPEQVQILLSTAELALAVTSTLAVMQCVADQIAEIEQANKTRISLRPIFLHLLTVAGIGQSLALTIMLEAQRDWTISHWRAMVVLLAVCE